MIVSNISSTLHTSQEYESASDIFQAVIDSTLDQLCTAKAQTRVVAIPIHCVYYNMHLRKKILCLDILNFHLGTLRIRDEIKIDSARMLFITMIMIM